MLQHPVTTEYQEARRHIEETLHAVHASGLATLWFWPNVDAGSDGTSQGIRIFREHYDLPNVHFFRNLPPEVFVQTIYRSKCLVGNSSAGIRECSFLGVPAVNIGSRQDGRDRGGNVIDVGYDREEILGAIHKQAAQGKFSEDALYGNGKAGEQIAELLTSVPLTFEKKLTY